MYSQRQMYGFCYFGFFLYIFMISNFWVPAYLQYSIPHILFENMD